jgi:hypothetical protein
VIVGYEDDFARIYVGDVLAGLGELADESIQVVVTFEPSLFEAVP